jgi:hypothetical protein
MRDARYLRSQAEFCLEMARNMADRKSADHLREQAVNYKQEADSAEIAEKNSVEPSDPQAT